MVPAVTTLVEPLPEQSPDTINTALIIDLVTSTLTSRHSQRIYAARLRAFLAWHTCQRAPDGGPMPLTRAQVQRYRSSLEEQGTTPSSVNQSLKAIKALAREAAANHLLDERVAEGIERLNGPKERGVRMGNWLPLEQAQRLLEMPDTRTVKGIRDRAILAVFLGCGLRREEVAHLCLHHIQQREGRWVIVDLVGKGQRVRSVPMPSWTKAALDAWLARAGISTGHVFRPLRRGSGRLDGERVTAQALYALVKQYVEALNTSQQVAQVAPHDLRRTFAKLAHKGHAPIEQIQLSLGHSSIQTTERYLGVEQDLTDAPCDHLGLRLG